MFGREVYEAHEKYCKIHCHECSYWDIDPSECPRKDECVKNFVATKESLQCSCAGKNLLH